MNTTSTARHLGFAVLAATVFFISVATANATAIFQFDASLGTLPSAQGWTHNSNGLPESNYSVSGGILTQGNTGAVSNVQNYQNFTPFNFLTDTVTMSLDLRVLSSGLNFQSDPLGLGFNRAGFGVSFVDSSGLFLTLFIGQSGLFLLGENNQSSGLVNFDSTNGFHDYDLSIDSTGATLLIDQVQTASLSISQFRTISSQNRLSFGDGTNAQSSSTQIRSVRATVTPPVTTVSEPGTFAVFAIGLLGLGMNLVRSSRTRRRAFLG